MNEKFTVDMLGAIIRQQFKSGIKIPITEEVSDAIDKWMEERSRSMFANTSNISNNDVRLKSIVMMFGKRFERLQKGLAVLDKHGLADNAALVVDIINIL